MPALHHRIWFLSAAGALIALAWGALWLWAGSPYGRYLHHGDWAMLGTAGSLCSGAPAAQKLLPTLFYVAGWMLMLTAMMLPTTLPLLEVYRRLTQKRRDRWLLVSLVVAGYLSAWVGFAVAADALDIALHEAFAGSPWFVLNGWAVGAVVVAVAGAFQFSSLKYRCLDKCRTTMSFIIEHWRGRRNRLQAWSLGFHHGLFCVGCCWALMLLMFVIGTGNVGWMLVLGAVMAAEKNLPWGRQLRVPLGLALLAGAAGIAVEGAGLWPL